MYKTQNKTIVAQFLSTLLLLLVIFFLCFKVMQFCGLFVEEIKFGLEKVITKNNQNYFISDNGYVADNGQYITNEHVFEGKYALKLDSLCRFGLPVSLDVPDSKDSVEASVWIYYPDIQKTFDQKAVLVASIGDKFWLGGYLSTENRLGWHKLQLKFTIPEGKYNAPLNIYCWNNSNHVVYYDNLIIHRTNYKKFF